jgi:hypothetical protein
MVLRARPRNSGRGTARKMRFSATDALPSTSRRQLA